jgi:hypothetical protein
MGCVGADESGLSPEVGRFEIAAEMKIAGDI